VRRISIRTRAKGVRKGRAANIAPKRENGQREETSVNGRCWERHLIPREEKPRDAVAGGAKEDTGQKAAPTAAKIQKNHWRR